MNNLMLAKQYYSDFIEVVKKAAPLFYLKRDRNSPEWFSFVQCLSNSAMSFYSFHTFLKREVYQEEEPHRIYNFYADLIVSKLKKAIFTENPRDSIQDVSVLNFEDFKDIFEYITTYEQTKDIKDSELFYFYLKAFCYFDLLFMGKEPKAFFPRFQPSVEIREKFREHLEELRKDLKAISISNLNKLREFKDKMQHLSIINLRDTISYYCPNLSLPEHQGIYASIFSPYLDPDKFAFDPLSRFYSQVLFKCLKILEGSFKYVKYEHNKKFIERLKNEFDRYLKELGELLGISAGTDIGDLMEKLLQNDYEFIENFIMEKSLNYGRHGKLEDIPEKWQCSDLKESKSLQKNGVQKNGKDEWLRNEEERLRDIALRYIFDPSELNSIRGPWKFENLIFNAPLDDIQYLMEAIATRIPVEAEDLPIIGILRSGSFMAYLYNVVTGNRARIMHFRSTPFVTIVPGSVELPHKEETTEVLIFDEAFKSGFTYQILYQYIARKQQIKRFRPYLFSLARVLDYHPEKHPDRFHFIYSWYYSGMKSKSKDLIYVAFNEKYNKQNKNNGQVFWSLKGYVKNIIPFDEKSVADNTKTIITIGEEKRYDILRLFSLTDAFWSIAKYFYSNIKESASSSKLLLVYGSPYAYLIALAIVLIARIEKDFSEFEIVSHLKKAQAVQKNSVFTVFLDIELFTGNVFLYRSGGQRVNMVCTVVYNQELKENKEIRELADKFIGIARNNTVE
ncbi:MAG: hypothetical protein DRG69_03070 [Deltaproteobacteria bacterium]|nr:MAG: hypothetical protein DRG69_03070 [Deltaproteobacteria bacterium]